MGGDGEGGVGANRGCNESGYGWGVNLRFSTLRLGPEEARPPGLPKDLICNNSDDSTVKQNDKNSPKSSIRNLRRHFRSLGLNFSLSASK